MAGGTCGPQSAELSAGMATGAGRGRVFPGQREFRGAVIEHRPTPLRCRVAGFATLRKARRNVVWIRSLLEVGKMARRARRSEPGEFPTHVAIRACRRGVLPGQREPRLGVIKLSTLPLDSRVAETTILREPGGDVIRIRRLLELRQMTRCTLRAKTRELAAHVAARTGGRGMFAREWKTSGRIVIEDGPTPLCRRVARLASLRESCRRMIRIGCLLEIRQVARRTRRSQADELASHVAVRASRRRMFPGQRKLRRAVVEGRARPLRGRVTRFTGLRETRRCVVWVCRLLEIRQVTRGTRGADSCKLAAYVTARAGGRGMFSRQKEFRVRVVIESRSQPLRCVVAALTRLWESGCSVIRIRSLLEIGQVATGTSGRQ